MQKTNKQVGITSNDLMPQAAILVKYTTILPSIGLNENDSKLYTNFEYYEGKIINI